MLSGNNRKILTNACVHFAGLRGIPGRPSRGREGDTMKLSYVCVEKGAEVLFPHPHGFVAAGQQLAAVMSVLPKGTPRKTTHSTAQCWTEVWGRGRTQNLLLRALLKLWDKRRLPGEPSPPSSLFPPSPQLLACSQKIFYSLGGKKISQTPKTKNSSI